MKSSASELGLSLKITKFSSRQLTTSTFTAFYYFYFSVVEDKMSKQNKAKAARLY